MSQPTAIQKTYHYSSLFKEESPFSATGRIPTLGDKSPLLTMPELYRRQGGAVNLCEKLPDVKQKPFLATV